MSVAMDSLSYIYITFDKKEESAKNMGTTLISCCMILKKMERYSEPYWNGNGLFTLSFILLLLWIFW